MHSDEDVDIKELLKVNMRLTRENNKLLKKMRRAEVLSFWSRIIFFLIISGSAYYAYQYYVRDYVIQMQDMYEGLQEGVDTVKTIPSKFGL